jgi:hypothetical protein
MGTIAARDSLCVVGLTEQVGAALMIVEQQAMRLRRELNPTLAPLAQ